MHSKIASVLFFILSMNGKTIHAQNTYFDRLYDFCNTTSCADGSGGIIMNETGDGYYFVSRSLETSNWFSTGILCKINEQGDTLFTIKIRSENKSCVSTKLTHTSDGGIVIGSTVTDTITGKSDYSLCKVNNINEIEFNKNYGDSVNDEQVFYVINTYDKGFLIVGQSVVPLSVSADMYVVKTDSVGNFEWDKYYGGSNFEGASSVIQTPDSGYLILGFTQSFGPNTKWYLVKTDKYGNQEWDKRYSSNDNQSGWGITKLNDGNYLMAGGGGNGNARIIKINPMGDIIWQRIYSNPNSEANYFYWAKELPDKTIIAVGGTNNVTEIDAGWIVKTDSVGLELWERKYNKTENVDLFYDFIKTDDGGFLLAGLAWNTSSSSQDAWLLRVDSLGCAYEDCTVGIEDEITNEATINIYPNPFSNSFNIEYSLAGEAQLLEIMVYDIVGRIIKTQQIRQTQSNKVTVDLGECLGIYFVRIIADGNVTHKDKIICLGK